MRNFIAPSIAAAAALFFSTCLLAQTAAPAWPIQLFYDENCDLVLTDAINQALALGGVPVTAKDAEGREVVFLYNPKERLIQFNRVCTGSDKNPLKIGIMGREFEAGCGSKEVLFVVDPLKIGAGKDSAAPPVSQFGGVEEIAAPKPGQIVVQQGPNQQFSILTPDGQSVSLNNKKYTTVKFGPNDYAVVSYDPLRDQLYLKNDCRSSSSLTARVFGSSYSSDPCGEKNILLSTGEPGPGVPGLQPENSDRSLDENIRENEKPFSFLNPSSSNDLFSNPNEGREPISAVNA